MASIDRKVKRKNKEKINGMQELLDETKEQLETTILKEAENLIVEVKAIIPSFKETINNVESDKKDKIDFIINDINNTISGIETLVKDLRDKTKDGVTEKILDYINENVMVLLEKEIKISTLITDFQEACNIKISLG